jgi:hypothetical protein
MLEGNTDEGYISLGTGIGSIQRIKSVAEVVEELTRIYLTPPAWRLIYPAANDSNLAMCEIAANPDR